MNERYKKFILGTSHIEYAKERDAHLYQLWKQGKTKDWIADYIGRSRERGRQLVKKFEAMARKEEERARLKAGQH